MTDKNDACEFQWQLLWNDRPVAKLEPDDSDEGRLRFNAIRAFCDHKFDAAVGMFRELAERTLAPQDESWHALTLYVLGRYSEACSAYEALLERDPENVKCLNFLAHLKATCELDKLRDGTRAIGLATRLCEISEWHNWAHLSVLAAAYAETGNWDQAVEFAQRAVEAAPTEEKDRRRTRLEQFQQRRPFRSSPEMNISSLIPNL